MIYLLIFVTMHKNVLNFAQQNRGKTPKVLNLERKICIFFQIDVL